MSEPILPPIGMLAELTHRCPLQCPYCSNPLELLKANRELDTQTWLDLFSQAADLGVLQVHLSGGEPTLRRDLEQLIAGLSARGVYTNLITRASVLDQVSDKLAGFQAKPPKKTTSRSAAKARARKRD